MKHNTLRCGSGKKTIPGYSKGLSWFGVSVIILILLNPVVCWAEGDFIIPCAALSRIHLVPGSWCRYLVVEEAMGSRDSSELYVSIPRGEKTAKKEHFWVEIKGSPVDSKDQSMLDEVVVVRLLVSKTITEFTCGDSLGSYIEAVYIKEGNNPVREGDLENLSKLSLESGKSHSMWSTQAPETLKNTAGTFVCEKQVCNLRYERKIPAGTAKLIQKVENHDAIWFSQDVPVFRMVRYTTERFKESLMDPPLKGVPVSGSRRSKTTVDLVSFGSGAKALLQLGK